MAPSGPCDPAKGTSSSSSPSWPPYRKWSNNVPWIVVITLLPVWMTSAVRVDEQRLLDMLMADYNTAARPVYNASQTVTVKFGLTLTQISDMDEVNQVLTINVWLEQEWEDERLVWDPEDYNGLEILRIPCEKIWLPDIVLYNSADDFTTGYMKSKAMVTNTGNVFWPPPAKFRSSCKIDITYFPFDDQVCELKFGSWTYDGFQVDITNRSAKVDLTNYVFSGEWELIDVRVRRTEMYYACCDMPYPDVRFTIIIRRKTLYYLFNIIFPCLWLTILSLLGFWLPPDSGEKITLGITVLLAFSVFMLLIAESMPATSEFVPLIGIYLTVTMAMTSMSIILTVFVLQLHHVGPHQKRVPRWMWTLVIDFLAPLVCLCHVSQRYRYLGAKLSKTVPTGRGSHHGSNTASSGSDRHQHHPANSNGNNSGGGGGGMQDEFRMSTLSKDTVSSGATTTEAGSGGWTGGGGAGGEVWGGRGRGACNGIILSSGAGGRGGGGGVGGVGVGDGNADKAYRRAAAGRCGAGGDNRGGTSRALRDRTRPSSYNEVVTPGGGGGAMISGHDRGSYVSAAASSSASSGSATPSATLTTVTTSSSSSSAPPANAAGVAAAAVVGGGGGGDPYANNNRAHVHSADCSPRGGGVGGGVGRSSGGRGPSPARRDSHRRPGEFLNTARTRGGGSSSRGGGGGGDGGGGGRGREGGGVGGSSGGSPLNDKALPAVPPADGSVSPGRPVAAVAAWHASGRAADTSSSAGVRAEHHQHQHQPASPPPPPSSGDATTYPRLLPGTTGGQRRVVESDGSGEAGGGSLLHPDESLPLMMSVTLPAVKFSGAGSEPALASPCPPPPPPPPQQYPVGDAPPTYQSWQAHQQQHPPSAASRDYQAPPRPASAGRAYEAPSSAGHVGRDTQDDRITQHLQVLVSRDDEDEYHQDVVTEWRVIAHVMDRLLFWLFLIVAIVSSVIILIVKPLTKPEKWRDD